MPASSEIFALVPLPLLKTNGTTASTAPSARAAFTSGSSRNVSSRRGRGAGIACAHSPASMACCKSLVEGAPHRRAARQIGKHHAVATVAIRRKSPRLLARRVDGIFLSYFEQGEIGPDLFRHACLNGGLEGMVSKHRENLYRGGWFRHWVK